MFDENKLKNLLSVILNIPCEMITDDSNMDTIKSWSSLKHMDIILSIEEEFNISIPDEDAANLTSYPLIRIVVLDLLENA